MADNGMVLAEVFGSDLSEDDGGLHLRRQPASPLASPRSPSPARSASPSPPPPVPSSSAKPRPNVADAVRTAVDSDDSNDDPPVKKSQVQRRPITFSDDDNDEEPAPMPRRRRQSEAQSDEERSDSEDERRRERVKRKSKKEKKKKVKKGKLRRKEEDEEEPAPADYDDERGSRGKREREEYYGDEEEEDPEPAPKKPKNAFEAALEENKALRRPRKKEVDPAKVEAECVAFLERMMKARDDDLKAYKSGRPALEKLKMLREVELMVMKVSHREQLMDNMLLAIFKAWLDPMPDGALPNVQIRSSLLQILSTMRVDRDWVERLENSQGLGRVVHYLSIKDDHPPNKRLAEKLMMRWARPVYQSNNNFHDLLEEFARPEEGRSIPKDGVASERRAARETVKNFKTAQEKINAFKTRGVDGKENEQVLAAIPRRTPFLYTTIAEGTTTIDDKQLREMRNAKARNKKVNRTMSTLRRANKNRSARAAKPSLNGR